MMAFGTPEKLLLEWMNMEVAARLGGGVYHGPEAADLHTNAPRCGVQNTAEKAMLAAAAAQRGARAFSGIGMAGMDELFSPVQLLLDMEVLANVQKQVDGLPVVDYDGDIAAEIREGLASGFIMSDGTLDNMERFIGRPGLFSRKSYGAYIDKPFPLEIEKAKTLAAEIMAMPPSWKIADDLQLEAERIYGKAVKSISG